MSVTYARLYSLTRQHHDLELLISRWNSDHTFVAASVEFTPTLEDVNRLALLPIFGKVNTMGIVLEEDDQEKLKYLIATMTARMLQVDLSNMAKIIYKGELS